MVISSEAESNPGKLVVESSNQVSFRGLGESIIASLRLVTPMDNNHLLSGYSGRDAFWILEGRKCSLMVCLLLLKLARM